MATPRTVLLVEDEVLIRFFMHELFEEEGWVVLEAGSGDDAMALLEANPVTVVVTDIEMPGTVDGIALSWHVYRKSPSVAVVITSARQLPRKSEIPPTSHFFAKPVPPNVLVRTVEDLLCGPIS